MMTRSKQSGKPGQGHSVSWLYASSPSDLGFTLIRPGGQAVLSTDADAITLDTGGSAAFYAQSKGFEISSPQAGTWQVVVAGTTIPNLATPYLVSFSTNSGVSLDVDMADDLVSPGATAVVTAQLNDNSTLVTPSSITATVMMLDGTTQTPALHDDGQVPDATGGDHIYSGAITTTSGCGTYRVKVIASGSTSEGPVTRESYTTFDAHVAGDTVRDPCNPDEDADGLLDSDEENIYHTNPLNADTDGDGLSDGAEVNTYHTDPLKADTDGDGMSDGSEVNAYQTNPLIFDRNHKADVNGDGYSAADEATIKNCGGTSCASIITFGTGETRTCKDDTRNCGVPNPPVDESVPVRVAPPPAGGYGCDVTLDTVGPLKTTKLAQSDVDLDGVVSILDLTKVANWFGNTINASRTDPRWEGDMDGDGVISILDLTAMAANFGRSVAGNCTIE